MKAKFELEESLVDNLTKITNRSIGQTIFLYNLLDGNFEKLLVLEEKIANTFYYACPGTKEEIKRLLSVPDRREWLRIKLVDCHPRCRIKSTPELTGIIWYELKKKKCEHCFHVSYLDQWGVYWDKEPVANWITHKNGGHPYFWIDRDNVEIIFNKK